MLPRRHSNPSATLDLLCALDHVHCRSEDRDERHDSEKEHVDLAGAGLEGVRQVLGLAQVLY